jgi:hypothetical protein
MQATSTPRPLYLHPLGFALAIVVVLIAAITVTATLAIDRAASDRTSVHTVLTGLQHPRAIPRFSEINALPVASTRPHAERGWQFREINALPGDAPSIEFTRMRFVEMNASPESSLLPPAMELGAGRQ